MYYYYISISLIVSLNSAKVRGNVNYNVVKITVHYYTTFALYIITV